MNFAFSEEQEELRRITRQFLESKSPESEVRRLMDTDDGYDPAVWSQMANELGLQSLIVPEEFGGQGFTFVELTVVLEEMGRALLCAPYFSSAVLATSTLLHAGDDAAKKEHLPGMAAGETIATLAFTEPNGKWDESGIEATATKSGDGWSITGTKMFVLDGNVANLLLVAAKTDAGVSIFAVDPTDASVTRTNLATMDQTRKQSKVELAGTPATLIGTDGAGWTTLERVLDLAAVALAAEQVGGAQKVLETAVQYAKDRVQFGRPIGSFQAIKHKCADMLLEVESAKSAAYYAAWCAAELNDELPSVASLAKAYCSEAYFHAAAENIQIHGGIGFTWEHPAHLYFKRAKSSRAALRRPDVPPRAARPAHRHLGPTGSPSQLEEVEGALARLHHARHAEPPRRRERVGDHPLGPVRVVAPRDEDLRPRFLGVHGERRSAGPFAQVEAGRAVVFSVVEPAQGRRHVGEEQVDGALEGLRRLAQLSGEAEREVVGPSGDVQLSGRRRHRPGPRHGDEP